MCCGLWVISLCQENKAAPGVEGRGRGDEVDRKRQGEGLDRYLAWLYPLKTPEPRRRTWSLEVVSQGLLLFWRVSRTIRFIPVLAS